MSGRFWPIAEPAQADYEQLRELVLTGAELRDLLAARRFERRGLAGLISWPAAEPAFLGSVIGATRPPWCGADGPRQAYLCDTYNLTGRLAAPIGRGRRRVAYGRAGRIVRVDRHVRRDVGQGDLRVRRQVRGVAVIK